MEALKGNRSRVEMLVTRKEFFDLMREGGSITRMPMTQMAKYMRVSVSTINKWIEEGGIKRWAK